MKFSDKDIEAVAKDRVNRIEKQKTTYWLVGALLALVAGYFVAIQFNLIIGFAICGAGVVGFFYYSNTLTKKQNIAKKRLLSEWKKEQGQVVK